MMFLLDTDVLSALRRRERNPAIVRWVETQRTADLYISVATVGEIERGITQQQRHNPPFARDLSLWLDRVLAWYSDRIPSRRCCLRSPLGPVVRDPRPRQRRSTHISHSFGAWPDRRYSQRPPLRTNRSTRVESRRVSRTPTSVGFFPGV